MDRRTLINAAMGRVACDTALLNANVIDVLGHSIKKANIYIKDGYIAAVGDFELKSEKTVDLGGKYVSPAFIDAHVHIESSMLTPSQYAKAVIPKGTGTVIADPHEIANVCGERGLEFMLKDKTPLKVHYMLPSCVPATPFDSNGAVLDAAKCRRLWASGSFLGLGEMMNYPGVISCDEDVCKKLELCGYIDGHVPMMSGRSLQAYICGGIFNDHECSSCAEALEKLSLGLNIYIREGTGAKNLEELIKAVTPYNMSHFAFCTDDKHLDEIVREGTISNCISKAIALGMDEITAFTLGTVNAARFYGLKNTGALAPGYMADMVIMSKPDPKAENIEAVYINGRPYEDEADSGCDISAVSDTVHIKEVTAKELTPVFDKNRPVIGTSHRSLITTPVYCDDTQGLLICANIERHTASGRVGTAYVKGFDIKGGAVAQTIGHDSHNITVLGDNAEDAALAVNSLGKSGGIAVVQKGEVKAFLPLECGGLMSAKPFKEVLAAHEKVTEAIKAISSSEPSELLMILSFLSLCVIPKIKLTDRGLFDVDKFGFYEP